MIVDAEALARAHDVGKGTTAPFTRWHTTAKDLSLRSNGPSFYTETLIGVEEPRPLNVAVPTALAGAWLKGIKGPVTVDLDGVVLRLASERSSIEISTQIDGPDLAAAEHLEFGTEGLTVLGLGGDIWSAINAVSWASALGSESNNDARFDAAHCSFGKVWATDRSQGAWIDMDLPECALPMIPVELGAISKLVDVDTAVIGVDLANRLRIIAEYSDVIAPLIAGEPFPDFMDHAAIKKVREEGSSFRFSAKAFLDALRRLDRVDLDQAATKANMKARVEVACTPTQIQLSVLVDKRRATEIVDADNDGSFTTVTQIGKLRSVVKFLDVPEVTLKFSGERQPIVADAGDRHLMTMPVTGKL